MIPSKVKIGYKNYTVELTDAPITVNGRECYGSIDYNDYIIKINKTYKEDQQKATFLHEVLHGISEMYMNSRLTEEDIELLGRGLYTFFVDNQEAVKNMFGGPRNDSAP